MVTLFKTRHSMILGILNYITDSGKTALTSVTSAFIGQAAVDSGIDKANVALQHAAWTIAILAGILTIVNLFFPLRTWYEEYKRKRHERFLNEMNNEDD